MTNGSAISSASNRRTLLIGCALSACRSTRVTTASCAIDAAIKPKYIARCRLGASVTPEAYFIDQNNKLLYHGRIDNSRNAAQVESNDLRNALDSALSGKAIEKSEAKAFGCSIKRG